jgi:hypothetical protein
VRRGWWALPVTAALALGGAACSSDSSSAGTTVASVPASAPAVGDPPRVDMIAPAIAAVEAELGGPQEYFEINATSKLVNVIVAVNDATVAQYWVYLDGELTSGQAQDAQGNTFTAAAVTFDPDTVLTQIQRDLPDSPVDLFFVEGGADGSVRYTALVSSQAGGQLEVIVAPDGTVQQVDADTGDAMAASTPTTTTG